MQLQAPLPLQRFFVHEMHWRQKCCSTAAGAPKLRPQCYHVYSRVNVGKCHEFFSVGHDAARGQRANITKNKASREFHEGLTDKSFLHGGTQERCQAHFDLEAGCRGRFPRPGKPECTHRRRHFMVYGSACLQQHRFLNNSRNCSIRLVSSCHQCVDSRMSMSFDVYPHL